MFSKQGFIAAFQSLEKGKDKEAANRYILELEAADLGWHIASELLGDANESNRLHGAQLLSKKATRGLPPNLSLDDMVSFLLGALPGSSKAVHGQLCLCIAKLVVTDRNYLASFVKSLIERADEGLLLDIAKEVPQCLSIVNHPITLTTEESTQLLNSLLPTIVRCFESNAKHQLALTCLDNFWEFQRVRILGEDIVVRCLTGLPLAETCRLLTNYFGSLSGSSVTPKGLEMLAGYVSSHIAQDSDDEFIYLFLSFARFYVNLNPALPLDTLQMLVSHTLRFIQKDKDFTIHTVELWRDIEGLSQTRPELQQTLTSAFFLLNGIVTEQSILKKLIPRNLTDEQHEENVEDVDQYVEPELQLSNSYRMGADSNLSFREESIDLIRLCYKVIKRSHQTHLGFFSQLMPLLEKNELTFELVIFVLKAIVDQLEESSYKFVSPVFRFFFKNFEHMSNDLLVPFLQLLFDCQGILVSDSILFSESIMFFAGTFKNPILQRVSTQTLSNIVREIQVIGPEIKDAVQSFINQIFDNLQVLNDEVVLDNLTGAIICYILKLEHKNIAYRAYLAKNLQKIQLLSTERMILFLKVIVSSHQANIKSEESMQIELAVLIERTYQHLLGIYLKSAQKKERASIMHIFKEAAKSCGRHIPKAMIDIAQKLLVEASGKNFSETGPLYFLVSILSSSSLSSELYLQFLNEYWEPAFKQIVGLPLTPELSNITIEILNKLVPLTKDFSTPISYALRVQNELTQNFETVRIVLRYFVNVVVHTSVDPQRLLLAVLLKYDKYSDRYWNQVQALLIEAYKKTGETTINQVLKQVKPELLPPNPVYSVLKRGLAETDTQLIKNSLLELRK